VAARYFAYPNGLPDDISPAVVDEVRALGFSHAFTMSCRVASASDDPLLLPRIPPPDVPGVLMGLSLARHLATAVARDTWRRWLGRPQQTAAQPPAVEAPTRPAVATPPPPPPLEAPPQHVAA
jgi:hypothetical protein